MLNIVKIDRINVCQSHIILVPVNTLIVRYINDQQESGDVSHPRNSQYVFI